MVPASLFSPPQGFTCAVCSSCAQAVLVLCPLGLAFIAVMTEDVLCLMDPRENEKREMKCISLVCTDPHKWAGLPLICCHFHSTFSEITLSSSKVHRGFSSVGKSGLTDIFTESGLFENDAELMQGLSINHKNEVFGGYPALWDGMFLEKLPASSEWEVKMETGQQRATQDHHVSTFHATGWNFNCFCSVSFIRFSRWMWGVTGTFMINA